jgi:hypothetical protein
MALDVLWLLLVLLGGRLAWQGARLRGDEGVLGLSMICLGSGAALLRHALQDLMVAWVAPSLALVTLGGMLMAWFTQRVFRPHDKVARAAVVVCALLLLGGLYHQLYASELGGGNARQSPVLALSRAAVMGWAAIEALRFRRAYVKRAQLGLADPVIANRFLLFSIWTSTLALMPLVLLAVTLASGDSSEAYRARVMVPVGVAGAVCLVSIFLTFLPPAAYLRYIARRASSGTP